MCRRTVGDRHRDVFVYESAVNDRNRFAHTAGPCVRPLAPLTALMDRLESSRLDTRVTQMLVFPQREAFLEIPTRFGKTASRRRVTYFPGATSLVDPNYQKRIRLDCIYDKTPRTLRL